MIDGHADEQQALRAPSDGAAAAVSFRGVSKVYGTNVALNDVTVDLPAGCVCGLVGPNGAGKSTLLSIAATLLRPTAGTVEVFGHPIADTAAVRGVVGYVPDVLGLYTGLSVVDYLDFFADSYAVKADQRPGLIDGLLELVDLGGKRDADVNTLSRGMKQRLALARGLINDPKLLLLDEPASGLDPRARIELRDIIAHLNGLGVTIVVSSHILAELEEMCSHALVIEHGRLAGFEHLGDEPDRVVTVTYLDAPAEQYRISDDAAQAALVARLVGEGRNVVSVSTDTTGLEARFMRLTAGELN